MELTISTNKVHLFSYLKSVVHEQSLNMLYKVMPGLLERSRPIIVVSFVFHEREFGIIIGNKKSIVMFAIVFAVTMKMVQQSDRASVF